MAFGLPDFSGQLDQAIADVQADVGAFLMQKARIIQAPDSQAKIDLLTAQTELEARAQAFVPRAQDLKAQLPTSFDLSILVNMKKYLALGETALDLAKEGLALRADMKAQVQKVDALVGGIPQAQALTGEGTDWKPALYVGVPAAALVFWLLYRRK
jgi:hypothetical protein